MNVGIEVQEGDALKIRADVLVLKYAQEFYGVDSSAFSKLAILHSGLEKKLPKPNDFLLVESLGALGAKDVLFAGVIDLYRFRYYQIRDFSFHSLKYLAEMKPDINHVCFTLHGANYGLDEAEAFRSEVGGMAEAIAKGFYPVNLERISIAEVNELRAKRLRAVLKQLLPEGLIRSEAPGGFTSRTVETVHLREAGLKSEEKPLIFVAMPFDKKMDDVFHYGIRNAVNSAGYLCERADEAIFTGDILELIKRRIGKASLVIADLTAANPNVYLEVGYAWGLGIPTVLIAQDAQELKFDVKGQKCIIYSGIRELEEKLSRELLGLRK